MEDAAIAREPEPAPIVGQDLGEILVPQTLVGAKLKISAVLIPAEALSDVPQPETAIGRGFQAPDVLGPAQDIF